MAETIIIGAGFAVIGAAHFLNENRIDSTVFKKREAPEENRDAPDNEFKFDYGSHIGSTQNKCFAKLFNGSDELVRTTEKLNISHFLNGYSLKDPPIENLHKLPKPLVIKIVNELSVLKTQNEKSANNLREWLYATFGKTYTDLFLEKLIQKTYTLPSDKIDFSEIINEFKRSSFGDILIGALTNKTTETNKTLKINYPLEGNLSTFLNNAKAQTKFGYSVKSIDPKKKVVFFENGKKESYSYLVSSIPLPDLIGFIKDIPDKIKSATEKLAYTSCILVDIETEKKLSSNSHCAYFYDSEILFSQLIFPQAFSEKNASEKHGSVQALVHFSKKYKPLHLRPNSFIEPIINNLKRCDILEENNKINYKAARLLPYANIIHDFNRKSNLSAIHKYLIELNIFYCGRYGLWTNLKADESFESGVSAAKKVKDILSLKTVLK